MKDLRNSMYGGIIGSTIGTYLATPNHENKNIVFIMFFVSLMVLNFLIFFFANWIKKRVDSKKEITNENASLEDHMDPGEFWKNPN